MGSLKFSKSVALFVAPAFILYTVFFLYPFAETAVYSLANWDGFTGAQWTGLTNFKNLLMDGVYLEAVKRIFIWAILSIIFKVGMALVISFVLSKAMRGITFFRAVVFVPYIISASAMCLMFTIMYDKEIGLINVFLRLVGLGSITNYWLSDPATAFYAVIAIQI